MQGSLSTHFGKWICAQLHSSVVSCWSEGYIKEYETKSLFLEVNAPDN